MTEEEIKHHMSFADSYSALPIILDLRWCMDDDRWLTLLGENWSRFDNVSEYFERIEQLILDFGNAIPEMMDEAEREAYGALPDVITIYRGCYELNKYGASWSLDRAVAEKFPFLLRYTQDGRPLLIKAQIEKKYITALKLEAPRRFVWNATRTIHGLTKFSRAEGRR